MCTLSWSRSEKGLEVWFNRDEQKSREVAIPPALQPANGPGKRRFLAPIDPQAGGTWLAANEAGVVVALLNRWHEASSVTATRSRGALVWELAGRLGKGDLSEFGPGDLEGYAPLTLVVFFPQGEVVWHWDGQRAWREEMPKLLTSSGYRFEEVKASRLSDFSKGRRGEVLHGSEGQKPSPFTVRMLRGDAQTWSRSRIWVTDLQIFWDYWAEERDLRGPARHFAVELDR